MKLYHNYKNVKEICHEIKNRNNDALKICTDFFLNLGIINNKTIIIPAPQHEGRAIYTLKIAETIAEKTGAIIKDIVKSNPRPTLYQMKKENKIKELAFFLTENIKEDNKTIFLLDNVLDTGKTFYTIQKLIKQELTPLVFAKTNNNKF